MKLSLPAVPLLNALAIPIILLFFVSCNNYKVLAEDNSSKLNGTLNLSGTRDDASSNQQQQLQQQCNVKLFKITGQIYSLQHDDITMTRMSLMNTRVLVNYGQYIAYPKEDGSFEVDNVPSDSYVVEVTHPKYIYEPARVDITSKGRIRARIVNYIQPSKVNTLDYPLRFRPKSLHNYFTPRETWRIMDMLFNPMVIMMVVPLVVVWLLPKMINPQEAQTQRDNMQIPEYNVPELSEMMANMFGGQGQASSGGSGGANQAITSGGGAASGGGGGGPRHNKGKRR